MMTGEHPMRRLVSGARIGAMKHISRMRTLPAGDGIVSSEDPTSEFNKDGADPAPTVADVGRIAYFAFLERGSVHGRDVEDWLSAEIQLHARRNNMHPHYR